MSALREAALRYAATGWAVFPIVPMGKLPLIPADPEKATRRGWSSPGHGCKDASNLPGKIAEWWKVEPRANIGVATGSASALLVIDLDSAEAARCYRERFDVGEPLIQRTLRGWHLFYRWTESCEGISISAGQLGEGIDMRGEGGYVVVAPSKREDGGYEWHNDVSPGLPPPSLIEACRVRKVRQLRYKPSLFERVDGHASRWGAAVLAGLCRKVREAPPGQQELLLNWAAFKAGNIVGGGEAASGHALDELLAAARMMTSYQPGRPWLDDELRAKIERGITDGKGTPRRAEMRA